MLDEEALIKGIQSGESVAIRQLIHQHQLLVLHMVSRVVSDPLLQEELCQDIFIKVFKNISKFKFRSKLSTWIGRIAYLSAINEARRQQNKRRGAFRENEPISSFDDEDPHTILSLKERNKLLRQIIDRLPFNYQVVVELYYIDGCALDEISEITRFPKSTIKTYLFRSRSLMKKKILKYLKNSSLWLV
jgi:RNA polymerase sigma-70 factor (ECF subfamily)